MLELMPEMLRYGLKLRLKVNNAQAALLTRASGASRFCYNFTLENIIEHQNQYSDLKEQGAPKEQLPQPLTITEVQQLWQQNREQLAPWHNEHHSKIYLFALRDAHAAHRKWLTGKTGFPHFKARRQGLSFRITDGVNLKPGYVKIPKIGWLKIHGKDKKQAQLRRLVRRKRAKITSAKIHQDKTGAWWASLTIERTTTYQGANPPVEGFIGVDLGVKTLAVAADRDSNLIYDTGSKTSAIKTRRRLKRAQKAMSRKDRCHQKTTGSEKPAKSPSKRREEARRRIAKLHQKETNIRRDTINKLTTHLAKQNKNIVIEDLNVKKMITKGGAHKTGINRAISEAAFGTIRQQLTQKLPVTQLIIANRFFASSKLCSKCGFKNQELTLAIRYWQCQNCGANHDRDINAAANLAAWGETQQGLTQAGDRQGDGPSTSTRYARGGAQTNPNGLLTHNAATGIKQPLGVSLEASGQEAILQPMPSRGPTA